ncbi:MAG: outer membrane lipid asymmetry maintenance protein MlaD [Gammaproteobacteria bacterium]
MRSRTLDLVVGVFVALGILALVALSMQVSNLSDVGGSDGYKVLARFDNVGGLKPRASVNMGGVRIGRVTEIRYDQERYQAVAVLNIEPRFDRLPEDTTASIFTAGLLGENYVGLEPGGSDVFLTDGDEIQLTQSALVLEQVIGQFLFSKASESSGDKGPAGPGSDF